jgi:hypothetical protein
MTLCVITFTAKYLQILKGRISAGCMWLYVVDLKTFYFLRMGYSLADNAT